MIKQFYMLSTVLNNYESISFDNLEVSSGLLYMLFLSFYKHIDWVVIEEREDKIYIWDHFDEDDYETWEEIPKFVLSKKNYEHVVEQWNQVVDQKPKYFILSYDDKGWVDLKPKNELSQNDWQCIDQEKYKQLS